MNWKELNVPSWNYHILKIKNHPSPTTAKGNIAVYATKRLHHQVILLFIAEYIQARDPMFAHNVHTPALVQVT